MTISSLVDPAFIRRLAKLPGADDENLATELVRSFVDRMPDILAQLRMHMGTGEWALLSRHAHSLRGSALLLGATQFAELARLLEHDVQAGVTGGAAAGIDRIDEAWPAVRTALLQISAEVAQERPTPPRRPDGE